LTLSQPSRKRKDPIEPGIPAGVNNQASVDNRMISESFARNVLSRLTRDALSKPGAQ
jgi:hypothetical protein